MENNNFQNFYNLSPSVTLRTTRHSPNEMTNTTRFLSQTEQDILRSNSPMHLDTLEEITVNGERGILMNKSECSNWKGELPLNDYEINIDPNPEIIIKKAVNEIIYKQDMAIRYLRPPTPPPPGDIYIREEVVQMPAAPPLIIRQQPLRAETPPPLVIREEPPQPPVIHGRKVIYVQGKKVPPPPRKVIIERLPSLPTKPQSIIIERWLPYKPLKRKVIFQRATNEYDPIAMKSKNLIVQWEKPNVTVTKEFKDLGIMRVNPLDYSVKYGNTLKRSGELPMFIQDIRPPSGMVLAAESQSGIPYELEGDLDALNLVDLESEGLNEYKTLLRELNNNNTETAKPSLSNSNLVNNVKQKNFIYDLFSLIDHTSSITLDEAEHLLVGLYTRLGIKYGQYEADHFFKQIEFNENGSIDLYRFRKILEKEFL